MKTWKKERSGYRSPMVADTEGNHSCGYPLRGHQHRPDRLWDLRTYIVLVLNNLTVMQPAVIYELLAHSHV